MCRMAIDDTVNEYKFDQWLLKCITSINSQTPDYGKV